jgi:NAD(P)-dependent dehydrogenase (short-subunit alcohol dehydrogenase family)
MAKGNGKIALVADASSGSGEATAERLAKAGYKVYASADGEPKRASGHLRFCASA